MSNIWQKVNHIFVHDTICTKHLTMKTDWLILLNAGLNFLLRLNWLIQNIWQIKLILPTRLCAQLLFNLMFSKWACKSHKSLDSFVIKLWLCEEIFSCHSRWKLSRNCPCSPFVPTLKALGLLLADGALTVGGEDFLTRQPGFFYANGCSSETEGRKMAPKVGNERSLRGLQTGRWPKLGSYGRHWILRPETKIFAQKNIHFFPQTMFRPRPEKVSPKKWPIARIRNFFWGWSE